MSKIDSKRNRKSIRGLGTLVLRGGYWHLEFTVRGERYRESSWKNSYAEAVQRLKERIGQIQAGMFNGFDVEKILMSELLDDTLDFYKTHRPRSLEKFAKPVIENHLQKWFGKRRAINVSTSAIREYIKKRLADGAAHATINRELSLLRRAFALARTHTPPKIQTAPSFKELLFTENNARKGFYEHSDFQRVRDALPADERAVFVGGYYTLLRYAALVSMRWDWVDFDARIVAIPRGVLKNSEPLLIPLAGPGDELFDMLVERDALRRKLSLRTPWVFFRSENRGTRGKSTKQIGNQLKCIRYVLDKVRTDLGLGDKLFHDLRRSGARYLRRAGVPESVIMKLGGWKTNNVFRRYNIMDESDLHDAARKRNEYLKKGAA